MSSTLFPAGLVPFEDLFSKPPNPMLGPGLTPGRCASDRGFYGQPSPDPGFGDPTCEPSDPPPLDRGTDGPRAAEPPPSGASPRWDFGDLFCKPPNPMLSPSVTLCEPPLPGTQPPVLSPRPAPQPSVDGAARAPVRGPAGPRRHSSPGDGKRRGQESGPPAAQGRQPPEDFAQLLERHRREREAPEAAPAPQPVEKAPKRGAGAKKAGRAKKRKRAGPAQGSRCPAAAPERAPVSEEFIQKNTMALGSRRVCKYFLAGRCVRGEQCRLDHGVEGLKFQQLCKFYVQGYCTRGDHCRFLHHEFPCKFFHTGAKCYQGEHCVFSHAPLTPETEGLLRAALAGPAPAPAPAEAAAPAAPS